MYRNDLTYSDLAPIVVVGDDLHAAQTAAAFEGAGFRVGSPVSIASAHARLTQQVAASAVWIELQEQIDQSGEDLLDQVNRSATAGPYTAVVATTSELIDPSRHVFRIHQWKY